jgi:hypothetical protein
VVISAAAATMISVAKLVAAGCAVDSVAMDVISAGDNSSCTVFKVSVMCIYKTRTEQRPSTDKAVALGRRHRKVEKTSTIKRCSREALGVEPGRCE